MGLIAARIEAAATGGAILASKDLIERLDPADAKATSIDPHAIAYTTVSELDGASDKQSATLERSQSRLFDFSGQGRGHIRTVRTCRANFTGAIAFGPA